MFGKENQKLLYAVSNKSDGNLSEKWGEEKAVLENRATYLGTFGFSLKDIIVMDLEHADRVTHITKKDAGTEIATEALITQDSGVVLFLLTADCLPISFFDPTTNTIALAHLGWKPTDKRLVTRVIAAMTEMYGSHPEDILVSIGPSIHKESYVLEEVLQNAPEWSKFLTSVGEGKTQVDLIGYNREQLLESGIREEHIEISEIDTAVASEYFSHYRSVRTGEPEGRFATILALR